MPTSIRNSLIAFCMLLISFSAEAKTKIVDSFSVSSSPKYSAGFTHFEYVNPKAPKGGKVTLPVYGSFDSFNPFIFKGIAFSDAAELSLESLGFSPLDDKNSVYPLLAEKFELSDNDDFIGFFLNKNAKFSDGTAVTADDVVFSFNSLIKKGSPIYKIYYSDVDRVEKINTHHVRFYFKKGVQNRELPLILSQLRFFHLNNLRTKILPLRH